MDDESIPLEGTSWLLAPSTPLEVDLGDVVVTAEFGGGRMTGSSGCNQYTTTFAVDGSALTIGPAIAGTKRFCDPLATTSSGSSCSGSRSCGATRSRVRH